MQYFLTNKFEYNFSGIEHAQIYRYKLFNSLGVKSKIITFEYTPAMHLFIKRHNIPFNISLNMFDFWQNSVDKEVINNIEYFKINKSKTNNRIIEYFDYPLVHDVYTTPRIKKIKYFNEYQNIIKIEYFDIRGFLSKISTFNKNNEIYKNEWFDIQGNIVLTENCLDGNIILSKHNPQYNNENVYTSWDSLKTSWLDFLAQYDDPVFYIDRGEYVSPLVINMKNKNVKKFIVLHSAHTVDRQNPYSSPLNDIRKLEFNHSELWSGYIAATKDQALDYQRRTNIPTFDIPVSYSLSPENIKKRNLGNSKHIIYLSRISREKRIEDAIASMSYIVKQRNDIDLKIYGYVTDSLYNQELHQLIKELSLKSKVELLPYNPDKKYLFSNSDIFLLTSEYEGFNMSMLEAASYGLPLISYDVKYGPKTIINSLKNGYLVESGNVLMLSKMILKIFNNGNIYQLFSQNGLHYLDETFGKNVLEKKWKDFFNSNHIKIS
ncbi:Glycosyltransferase involved in cell wall bisynthesis (RfaB) [Fructobacillus evanidus]|uniref:glycosyltransferase n=1 Tax=Fructobacillus evanidus TaxID=3064281 RepID=UPI002DB14064|nr:Glycosyltransferase involved in cell wall bisynthesis (RfaB) [Fructobacillus sp. LMG 32999]